MKRNPSMANEELRTDIQIHLRTTGKSPEKLSVEAGLSRAYIRSFLAGRLKSVSLESALKIREVLHADI